MMGFTEPPVLRAPLPIRCELDVVSARETARELGRTLGFDAVQLAELVTSVSEIGNNIAQHAGEGEIRFELIRGGEREGLEVIARDRGPGIADPERVLEGGHSTAGGLGLGLSGARRMMDAFTLETAPGQGTTVRMSKWAKRQEGR